MVMPANKTGSCCSTEKKDCINFCLVILIGLHCDGLCFLPTGGPEKLNQRTSNMSSCCLDVPLSGRQLTTV
jgi:hypothetical protein